MVDGTDLYGQVFFQAGRFRRVAFLPEASSRGCRALVRGGDDLPWFGAVPGPVDAPLVLGSPGLNDATLHVLQACLPHRRVLATGCESVAFSGREVRGALRVQAVRRPPMAGDAAGVWDVVATDATGQPVVTWQGVRLRDVGALAPAGPWHPALLAISMEARAAEFGLDPALRAVISCAAPPRDSGAGCRATAGSPAARTAAPGRRRRRRWQTTTVGRTGPRAPGRWRASSSPCGPAARSPAGGRRSAGWPGATPCLTRPSSRCGTSSRPGCGSRRRPWTHGSPRSPPPWPRSDGYRVTPLRVEDALRRRLDRGAGP